MRLFAAAAFLFAAAGPSGADPPRESQVSPALDDSAGTRLLEETLASLRESHPAGPDGIVRLSSGGPFWRARLSLALAASAAAGTPLHLPVRSSLPQGDPALLGLAGLDRVLSARAALRTASAGERGSIGQDLLSLAETLPPGAVGRAALLEASRVAPPSARERIRRSVPRLFPEVPSAPRLDIGRALVLVRTAPSPADRRQTLAELVLRVPDAKERARELFEENEARLFDEAAVSGPALARLARARLLLSRHPEQAALLALSTGGTRDERTAGVEILVLSGHTVEARRRAEALLADVSDGPEAARVGSLAVSAELRRLTSPGPPPGRKGRKARRTTRLPAPPTDDAVRRASFARLAGRSEKILAGTLAQTDRHRLLADLARTGAALGEGESALAWASQLVSLEPESTAGVADLHAAAFALYRSGGSAALAEAARRWQGIASTYHETATRRRATYWLARCRQRGGDEARGRQLLSTLVTGTAPDVFGLWAAELLGIPFVIHAPADGGEDLLLPPLPSTAHARPERELLACSLPGLAEDEAEAAGRADPLFRAAAAAVRGDLRRAAGELKARWPVLGTPEEGNVPTGVRRTFYPAAHGETLRAAAEAAGVPPALFFGLVRQESVFVAGAASRSGAVGLAQVMPRTGRSLHRKEGKKGQPDLRDPDVSARLGARYLREMLQAFGGNTLLALAAYNAGPSRAARWRREMGRRSPDELLESIPFAETRDYVRRVLFYGETYAALRGIPARATGAAALPEVTIGAPF